MRKYRNYTDEDIIKAVKNVQSLSGLCRAVGIKAIGGNLNTMRKNVQRLSLDTSHWTGMGWSANKQLKNWTDYVVSKSTKPHLISLRGNNCEWCSLSEWREKPITLELDHIDGDRTNNELSNLRLLCPNCHSQTDTWRGRNRKN